MTRAADIMFTLDRSGTMDDRDLLEETDPDSFVFVAKDEAGRIEEADRGGWLDIIEVMGPASRAGGDGDDDDGLPDTIIWCIDGDGSGTAQGEEIVISYEIISRTWTVDGEPVDQAGQSALLFL